MSQTSVKQVKLHKVTQAQYNSLTKNPNDFYVITDAPELQEKLISGTNIKTINNESLLTSGNINIPPIQVVTELPASPVAGTIYIVTGE